MGRDKRIIRKANRKAEQTQRKIDNFKYSKFSDAAAQGIENPYGDVTNAFADTKNPFADVTNPFADVTNAFSHVTNTAENLTNPFADLRVSTEAAEFQAEQNAQNQANILDALIQGGASAGASATALVAQAANANKEISANIAQQEAANEQMRAQGEAQRQQAWAQGEARMQDMFGQGLQAQQMAVAGGDQWAQQMLGEGSQFQQQMFGQGEQMRQQLLGQGKQYMMDLLQTRDSTRLEGLYQQKGEYRAMAKAAQDRRAQRFSAIVGAVGKMAGAALGNPNVFKSDRRLKENIEKVGVSPSGINIYEFNYIGKEGRYQGVIADEVPHAANYNGDYASVDYSKVDVEFKKID